MSSQTVPPVDPDENPDSTEPTEPTEAPGDGHDTADEVVGPEDSEG